MMLQEADGQSEVIREAKLLNIIFMRMKIQVNVSTVRKIYQ
jgi:hypothetical protein